MMKNPGSADKYDRSGGVGHFNVEIIHTEPKPKSRWFLTRELLLYDRSSGRACRAGILSSGLVALRSMPGSFGPFDLAKASGVSEMYPTLRELGYKEYRFGADASMASWTSWFSQNKILIAAMENHQIEEVITSSSTEFLCRLLPAQNSKRWWPGNMAWSGNCSRLQELEK